MDYFIVFFPFFAVGVWINLHATVGKKDYSYLWVQIPAFVIALVVNLLIAANVTVPSVSSMLMSLIDSVIK
ncbi:MAG: hypothetical protein ACFWUC_04080 [Oscillospiraceae bacterium]